MEIIEIPDDSSDAEIISLGSSSNAEESTVDSDSEKISNSKSQLKGNANVSPMFQGPVAGPAAGDANDFWGHQIPRPYPAPNPSLLAPDILEADLEIAAALDRFGHDEPDWGEFLEDIGSNFDNQDVGYARPNSSGQGHIKDEALTNGLDVPIDHKVECVDEVLSVFPDICRDYVSGLYEEGIGEVAEQLVAHILDKLENGSNYPKAKEKLNTLKRKREVDEDEEAATKYGNMDREHGSHDYSTITRSILSGEFVYTPMVFIDSVLKETRNHLFPAYLTLEEAQRTWDPARSQYNKIKKPRTLNPYWTAETVEATLSNADSSVDTMLALRELQAVRRVRRNAEDKRQAERQAQLDEEENTMRAEAEGTMLECGCCCGDFPLNRMIHCDDDRVPHWFCRACATQTAETEIGNSKYKIICMSMEGCQAGFSREMKAQFLDEKLTIALDRNEQEEMLRLAGIENLASCPFCPFAAEYPPVEQDREFRCQAPDCEKVSCRLCNLASHIPKTCAENAKDNGLSVRRQIEEAMSAALIRTCNKCGTPFIKEEGCNKMTCTRSGCYNVQCYVCSKSCSYDHFNDRARGGKPGNCPLFESVEERHQEEVKKAEKEALEKVRAEHPEYTEEDLKVKVSENVRQDDERRRTNHPMRNLPAIGAPVHRAHVNGVHVLQHVQQQVRARGHRHRVEVRRVPPQVIAQDIGPWPEGREILGWQYEREDAPALAPGASLKADAPNPIIWPGGGGGNLQQPDLQPLGTIPEPPVWQGGGMQRIHPGPHLANPEPFGWNFPDAAVAPDGGMDAMLGYLRIPEGPKPAAIAMNFGVGGRDHQLVPLPPGAGAPNNEPLHGAYDGGQATALDQLRELRLRQQLVQNQAQQQRPRMPRSRPVPPPQPSIALRQPRGSQT